MNSSPARFRLLTLVNASAAAIVAATVAASVQAVTVAVPVPVPVAGAATSRRGANLAAADAAARVVVTVEVQAVVQVVAPQVDRRAIRGRIGAVAAVAADGLSSPGRGRPGAALLAATRTRTKKAPAA